MLHPPVNGGKVFEVSIYNRDVRALVKESQSHGYFDDRWADLHVHNIIASNETEARALVAEHFPPTDGFVIEGIYASCC
ncbi:MAG: hypothetical protein CMM74_15210 [Rhodospirillaceae bacterium]|jgi:hypothetical protein|nr:hypothetical protein [Rhodospirillaceae bacterium]MDP6034787.1 hypothetical protein [Verrucomicrobiota bacterium]|tara:strand:+ start:53 stop:289 length:237 start_codon:yes stop_codon:yes gene_type:complete